MKQKLLLISFILFGVSVMAQNYRPVLDELNEWHVTSCYFGCHTDVYFTDGDTLVNGKSYKILDGYHYISRTFLLREDIASKKVYLNLIDPRYNEEYLLYDFTLNEGDVFNMQNPISPFPEDGGPFLLDSIVAKPLVDGANYRHFYFSPTPGNTSSTNNAVWVEGVGSLSLINAPGGKPNINAAGHLSCFFKNTEVFYANLDSIDDCIPLHLQVKNNKLQDLVLSKQNNSDECVLTNAQNVKKITVFNLSGKKLDEKINNGNTSLTFNLSGYQNGLYIILASGIGNTQRAFKINK
ncbi:T9SS type A sorting domain-containing protein [Aequorivita marina]|uniref:T9SS type A sorting domain-containing protein n=1 Tax=Aequorivita marina TaxID=3073654 RepID=UPI0028742D1C|nr:T9SS type A sorting domain-containing protein [Aequorivita sp. S2608]MDS1297752.1 T9SS type A sorting domain-containing protein [Aequorivita sp. S2608]